MRIYLADLFHVYQRDRNPDTNPYTVPLGIGYLATTVKHRLPGHEIRLFRDPDKLLHAVRTAPPDVMGFSFCSWNSDLSHQLARIVKSTCPGVLTVGGGPSIDDVDSEIADFLKTFPEIDYLVPNEGETGFLSLLGAIVDGDHRDGIIPGVAYLDPAGNLVRGAYGRPVVPDAPGFERISPKQVREITPGDVEVPSPYLDGTLDEFLDDGLVPILQTMRGCPYQCHFCVSGATEWNKMRGYELDRVKAEIEYALSRSRSKDLILTDENWGILGERDVELARFIMDRYKRVGTPNRLYYYTAKIVTPASRAIVELVSPIAWIGEFSMSFQSLNPETRAAIKRTNISMDKLAANIEWARERDILTSSEMIYGFPYENPNTFFDGVERLVQEGVSSVVIFPLQLFSGIDLAAKKTREEYGFKTRFRLADCGYGVYDGGKLVSAECEEVVVGNKWSTEEDYFTVRRYGFFQQVIHARGFFLDLFRLCSEVGISFDPIVRRLATADYAIYPAIQAIMADHRREAEAELKATRDEVHQDVVEELSLGREKAGVKVNLVYFGRLLSSTRALTEFLSIVTDYFKVVLQDHPQREVVMTFINDILPHRLVAFERGEDRIGFETRFDYAAWSTQDYEKVDDLLLATPCRFESVISDELKANLAGFDPSDRGDLQGIFDRTKSKLILREIIGREPAQYYVGARDRRAFPRMQAGHRG